MIRLFIAVDLPEGVKDVLMETAVCLAEPLPKRAIRWARREQLHLTLRFLGETAVSQLPKLRQEIDQAAASTQPIQLCLNGVGAFPNRKRPRVVWAGLSGALTPLQQLQSELDARVKRMGWIRDKWPFNPHITLGRVKNGQQARGINWDVGLAEMGFGVTAVQLMQSELRPSGAVYTVRHEAPLGAKAASAKAASSETVPF